MKCYIYKNKENTNLNNKLKVFLQNRLNQSSYKLVDIYNNYENFDYNYIICKENDEICAVMPFILYKNKLTNIIHSMPFIGYGGIDSVDDKKEIIFKYVIEFLEKIAKKKHVKLITICTQPFKEDDYNLYKEIFKPNFERKNFYQYIDLSKDVFSNMKSKFRGNLRRNIKKCTDKYNVEVIESYDIDKLKYWYENVYIKRLTETGCAIYPYSVFETLITKSEIGKVKMLYGILDNKIIAGGLYLNQGKSIDNFMRVVSSEYLHTQIGTYLDYLSIKYAIENNFKYYNWQSCDEIGSSIFKYKEEWGSELEYHYYLTKVIGDIEELKKTPIEIIKENFKGIYVLPYEEFI